MFSSVFLCALRGYLFLTRSPPKLTARIAHSRISSTMPLYEYQCKKCKHRFEKILKFSDKPISKCPECGGPVEQLLSAPAVQFKGSGWYVTDYAKKSSAPHSASSSESDGGTKATKDTKETREAKKDDKARSDTSHRKHKKD